MRIKNRYFIDLNIEQVFNVEAQNDPIFVRL
jgi:hypothetical protein